MISETGFTPDQEARYQTMLELRPETTREEFAKFLRDHPAVGDPMPETGVDLWAHFFVNGADVRVVLKDQNERGAYRKFDIYTNGVLRHPNADDRAVVNMLAFYSGDLEENPPPPYKGGEPDDFLLSEMGR